MTIVTRVGDFETASSVDLKKAGAWAYAEHPTTEVLCFSFEWQGAPLTWYPGCHPKITEALLEVINDLDVMFVSHGDFERAVWKYQMVAVHGFPALPNERWHDTMAVAAMKQLPLELDKLIRVLGLPDSKDKEGSALTRSLSKFHKKTGHLLVPRTPEVLARVRTYCESDVRSERGVLNRIGFLQPGERRVWLLDQTINQRGVRIDLPYVLACQKIVDGAKAPLEAEFSVLTGGLKPTQRDKVMGWISDQGANIPDMRKETLSELLGGSIDEDDEDAEEGDESLALLGSLLPPNVRRALHIRQLVGSASIKKLPRMVGAVNSDGRARGLLQYHRAGPGRWAGRIIQPQNFPRPSLKYDDKSGLPVGVIVGALMTGDWEYVQAVVGPPVEVVVNGLRHALIADPGKAFISADFSTIEARVVLALAGQHDKTAIMASGKDIYIDMASQIYGRPIDKKKDPEERQTGKNSVLGLGFQMGARKFHLRYCEDQSLEFAQRVVDIYRKEWAPLVPEVWRALQNAAVDTVWTKQPHEAYGVEYRLEDGWLTARLPSGRKLFYWNPQPVSRAMPWSTPDKPDIRPTFTYQAIKMGRWTTIDAFGGLLTENVVQALARDLLVAAMFRLEANGYPIVLTVHDEALVEVLLAQLDEKAVNQIMCVQPDWAKAIGIPVAAETWSGDRYRK